jgi:hypothetical protein
LSASGGLAIDRLHPTHEITADGHTADGWCAWDTLFITELLDTQTEVASADRSPARPSD